MSEETLKLIADLRAVGWRLNDPTASSTEKALMKLCGHAADEIERLGGRQRLQLNPKPLSVVERRDNVTALAAIRGRSREDRLRVWLALGGTEDDFETDMEWVP